MRKKIIISGVICLTVAMLAGCGENSNSELYNSLEHQVKHNLSYIEKDQLEVNLNLQAAINGNEKELIVKVKSNGNIMNVPANEGTIVGTVKAKESVLVIGEDSISGWYKVAYNGRVCYIEGTKLDMNTYVADNDDANVNDGDNSRPTTTVTPQRPVATTTNKNNSTSTTNKKDDDEDETTSSKKDDTTSSTGNGNSGDNDQDIDDERDTTTSEGTDPSEGDSENQDNTSSSEENTTSGNDTSEQDTTEGDSSSEEETTTSDETTTGEPESPSEEETTPPSDIEE